MRSSTSDDDDDDSYGSKAHVEIEETKLGNELSHKYQGEGGMSWVSRWERSPLLTVQTVMSVTSTVDARQCGRRRRMDSVLRRTRRPRVSTSKRWTPFSCAARLAPAPRAPRRRQRRTPMPHRRRRRPRWSRGRPRRRPNTTSDNRFNTTVAARVAVPRPLVRAPIPFGDMLEEVMTGSSDAVFWYARGYMGVVVFACSNESFRSSVPLSSLHFPNLSTRRRILGSPRQSIRRRILGQNQGPARAH